MTPDVVAVGQNKYFPVGPQAVFSNLGGGLIALRMMVNLNVCTAAFYRPGSLLDCMREFKDVDKEDGLGKFVQKLRVETNYLKGKNGLPSRRVKTICGLAPKGATAEEYKFPCKEFGGMVTVEAFFKRSKSIALNSRLPAVFRCHLLPPAGF